MAWVYGLAVFATGKRRESVKEWTPPTCSGGSVSFRLSAPRFRFLGSRQRELSRAELNRGGQFSLLTHRNEPPTLQHSPPGGSSDSSERTKGAVSLSERARSPSSRSKRGDSPERLTDDTCSRGGGGGGGCFGRRLEAHGSVRAPVNTPRLPASLL
ncbi:hypothetical protein SRHO_G00187810 [Serrasalmus rhombeus]